jgi:hypothetical protein
MYCDKDGNKKVAYYVAMPSDMVDAFKTKFNNHEQWRKSTLEEVKAKKTIHVTGRKYRFIKKVKKTKLTKGKRWDYIDFPTAHNTDVYALKYKRHDMFSLKYSYDEQTKPVRDVIGVTNELKPGESVDIFIRTEAIGRKKWKNIADYAWDLWKKGGVPTRAGFDPLRLVRNLYNAVASILFEIKSLGEDIMLAVQKTFMPKTVDNNPKKERPKFTDPEREELLVNGDLSQRTKQKRNLPVFKQDHRIVVHSPDPIRREMLGRSAVNAYSELSGDNRLDAVKFTIRGKKELNDLRNFKISDKNPNYMSVDEVGKLEQLPTSELQQEFKDALESNQRVEIDMPKVFIQEEGILAGTATDRCKTFNVKIPTKNPDRLFTMRAFVGMQGMGKDQAINNLIVEAKRKHNIGAVILDVVNEQNGHRGMGNALRDHIPAEDIIDINLADTSHPIYLGLEGVVKNIQDNRIAFDRISEELSAFLLGDDDDDKFQTLEYLREAAKVTGGDIIGIKHMFTNQKYRKQKIKEYEDIFDMDIWEDFDSMTDKNGVMSGKQGQLAAPILRRIGQIMGSEFLKPIFCQIPNPEMDLYKWIDEGKVVIFRFPKADVASERVKELLSYWIILNVFLIKLAQDGKHQALGTYLVLNEPHQFLSKGLIHFLERMLYEGRKLRLAPVFAFHHFQQFKKYPGFVDLLIGANPNWHIFKNSNINMYEKLMPFLSKTFETPQQAFEATKAYQYIACWLNLEAEYEAPFVADALPLVWNRYESQDNSFLTKRHSRQFGRPIEEVLAEIKQRNKIGKAAND